MVNIKNTRSIIVKFQLLVVMTGILILCGCGQEPIAEPPLEKNRVLIDALRNIRDQRHGVALQWLKKLKVIYPDNTHLAMMCETEYDNIFIQKIQSGLNKGDIASSLSIIKRAEKSQVLNQSLHNVKEQLLQLDALNNALAIIGKTNSSATLMDAVSKAQQIIKKYPAAKSYLPLLAKYEKLAAQMAVDEENNAKSDLASDFKIEKNRKKMDKDLVKILAAQTEVENASIK
jgi:hypothetical protein